MPIDESQRRAEVATEEIGACLETTEVNSPYIQGAYTILKRWYHHALARQLNPSQADLEKVSWDYSALYQWEDPSPPGRPVPTHVSPFKIDNGVSIEAEVEAEVPQLRVNRAGGHTNLQA